MALIPQEIIQSIQDSTDIVDVVSEFVSLKRSGTTFKGLCPFHDDKSPSFHVWPHTGTYKCFSCDEGGNAIRFLMQRTGMSFRDVCQQLADKAGIVIPEEEQTPQAAETASKRRQALEALRFAAAFYQEALRRDVGQDARAYLADRSFTEGTLETFEIGYSLDRYEGLFPVARKRGFSERALFDAGLVRRREQDGSFYDAFRGRIMFPIHDLRGDVVAFGARAMGDAQPKYLNSQDGPTFRKGSEMYGLRFAREAARKTGRLIVVEGYTDVMHCHQAGVEEVAAGLGTALTPANAGQLRRFAVPVVLLYDGDQAGRNAAERAAETLLAEGVEGSVALLPPGKDPADYVRAHGREGLDEVIEQAQDLWSYRMEAGLQKHNADTLDGRMAAVQDIGGAIARIQNPARAEAALKLLAERTGITESTLRNTIQSSHRPVRSASSVPARPAPSRDSGFDARSEAESRSPGFPEDEAAGASATPAWLRMEEDLLRAGWFDPALWLRIVDVYPPPQWQDGKLRYLSIMTDDLRAKGQSFGREALLSVLAANDEAVSRILSLEPSEDACERSSHHLSRLADRARRRAAMHQQQDPLAALVRARGGNLVEDRTTDRTTDRAAESTQDAERAEQHPRELDSSDDGAALDEDFARRNDGDGHWNDEEFHDFERGPEATREEY